MAVTKPEIHIEYRSDLPHTLSCSYENWRWRKREVTEEELHQCRDLDFGYPGKVWTLPDEVEAGEDSLIFYHRNRNTETAWDVLIRQQQLEPVRDKIPNPLKDRMMGGLLRLPGMEAAGKYSGVYAGTDYEGYSYRRSGCREQEICLTLLTECCEDTEQWKKKIEKRAAVPVSIETSKQWWREYFGRSYIHAARDQEGTEAFEISRNYQLFRYMLGCNYYGEYPTKFNGGLFTFDEGKTPDFRMWSGSGFTSQNQRLVYWGMLKTGDFEGMLPQLHFFRDRTEAAKARCRHFFHQPGAFFYEQGNLFGICTGAEYGWTRDDRIAPGLEDNPWIRLHFSSGLEFALMMLEYSRYSQAPADEYLDYIESILDFYMNYYSADENGRLYIFPSTALETYKGEDPYSKEDEVYGCANPMDAAAGLRCVITELLDFVGEEKKEKYRSYLEKCPELPVSVNEKGEKIFLPAEKYSPVPFNCELPELYPVFPYSPYGLSEEEIQTGRNTYFMPHPSESMYLGCSWHQNGIFAARLGLVEEAWKYQCMKLKNGPKRFPAFWGPGHDWSPDHNQGGSGMIGLQEMLMQCGKDEIILLPCWDRSIDVSFRLYAPQQTVVECEWKNGRITHLQVTPEARKKDVVLSEERKFEEA